jgi:dissimilatory sulfite reductase (desulfoviridin) alpha/beta subunit
MPLALSLCRGAGGECARAVAPAADLTERIERTLTDADWAGHVRDLAGESLRHHHRLKVTVSACPNACSMPQIADFGLIRARTPVMPEKCSGCAKCIRACAEKALSMSARNAPLLNERACLGCGECIAACDMEAIESGAEGWRVLLGGRMGRHPRLALESEGLFTTDEAMTVLRAVLERCKNRNIRRVADLDPSATDARDIVREARG